MKNFLEPAQGDRQSLRSKLTLALLIGVHSIVCCVSLIQVAQRQFYIFYDDTLLVYAIVGAVACSTISLLFVFVRFSFGYFAGFYLYSMVLGFIWIDTFSKYSYDKKAAAVSAVLSLLLFLAPALLIKSSFRYQFELSRITFDRLLQAVLAVGVVTAAVASTYHFRLVSIMHIYDFRDEIEFPGILRYLIGINTAALLPFTFAGFLVLRRPAWAAATLLLLLLYYPITLSKFAFFASTWLIVISLLTRVFEARRAVIITLLLPMLVGVIVNPVFAVTPYLNEVARPYFNLVNIRMMAIPSSAMDIYNEYFSYHPLTYYCQISFLKTLTHCPYQAPLSVVMNNTYGFGNLNASLFATEGVA
jgi:hypothetical protein